MPLSLKTMEVSLRVTLQIVQQFSKLDQLSRKAIYDMSAFESYSLKHEQTWDSPTIKRISLSSHVCPGFLRKSHNNYAN